MADPKIEEELAATLAEFYADPLGHVMWAYDWGNGELKGFDGPDDWQRDYLIELGEEVARRGFDGIHAVEPIRMTTASGHGAGKSSLSAWIIGWIMSTRPHCKGVVTANTATQLESKTWSELHKWNRRAIYGHWFEVVGTKMYHKEHPKTWRVDGITCREENSEAFAGLHAADSTPFYLFDEACHDEKTEVLSDRGWIRFSEVTEEDRLLTMDITTGRAYYDKPTHIHRAYREGKMLLREGRGSNFCVTPNHRMMYTSRKLPNVRRFEEADKMVWSNKRMERTITWHNNRTEWFTIPSYSSARTFYPSLTVRMDDWCEFLGWYMTEGCVGRQNGAPGLVQIAQSEETNPENFAEIVACVERMGFNYGTTFQSVIVYEPAVAALLDSYGKTFANKRVPQEIKDLGVDQLNKFLDSAVKGDGHTRSPGRQIIYTSNEGLAGDYQEMILKTGCNSTVTRRKIKGQRKWIIDHWAVSSCDGYVVSRAFNASQVDGSRAKPIEIEYSGMVYCATISGGVLLTRRGGVPLWSGNSAVPDAIWDVAEGGLTDGEPQFHAFGNPTRRTGRFFENTFGRLRHRWIKRSIDSRTCKFPNRKQIEQWAEDYGEDSDFFRVRVRGLPPRASDLQFIDVDTIAKAQRDNVADSSPADPLIAGIDIARGGTDNSVIRFRRGLDARSIPPIKIPGEDTRDTMRLVSVITGAIGKYRPDAVMVDGTGVGGPVIDRLQQLGFDVYEVQFGGKSPDRHCANMRAYMWYRMKEWLRLGAIDDDPQLEIDLGAPEYMHDKQDRLVLESKEAMKRRGLASPDDGDALALTFAYDVEKPSALVRNQRNVADASDYDPLENF